MTILQDFHVGSELALYYKTHTRGFVDLKIRSEQRDYHTNMTL